MIKQHAWLWIGASASVICSILTTIDLLFLSNRNISALSSLIYACSLMVVPFALWYRIEDTSRKWKARICNGLTMLTALFAILVYIKLAASLTTHELGWSGTTFLLVASGCMAFMGWVLWDGGSTWLGLGALTLATLPWTSLSELIDFLFKGLWFLLLAYWLLQPIRRFAQHKNHNR